MPRISEVSRKTKETEIYCRLNLDGSGNANLDYPIGFMSHMFNTFARHGLFDIELRARGDLEVDQHHLVEDTGLVLGECFSKALGNKKGIRRAGDCSFPMDETLARASVDISGRPFLFFEAGLSGVPLIAAAKGGEAAQNNSAAQWSGDFQTDTVEDFWQGFVSAAAIALHLEVIRGRSDHHKIEALFKAAARSLRNACEIDPRSADVVPSTKGMIA